VADGEQKPPQVFWILFPGRELQVFLTLWGGAWQLRFLSLALLSDSSSSRSRLLADGPIGSRVVVQTAGARRCGCDVSGERGGWQRGGRPRGSGVAGRPRLAGGGGKRGCGRAGTRASLGRPWLRARLSHWRTPAIVLTGTRPKPARLRFGASDSGLRVWDLDLCPLAQRPDAPRGRKVDLCCRFPNPLIWYLFHP
jgi:hypothetical protein